MTPHSIPPTNIGSHGGCTIIQVLETRLALSSIPCLNLDRQFYKQTSKTVSPKRYSACYVARYYAFLSRALERRSSLATQQACFSHLLNLHRLFLFLPFFDCNFGFQSMVDKLLEYAFSSFKIEELEFGNFRYHNGFLLKLPSHVNAHSLKSLLLNSMAVNQHTVDTLALNCPFLELFKLHDCTLCDPVIQMQGLSKLTELCLITRGPKDGRLVIDLPSLHSLYYSRRRYNNYGNFDIDIIRAGELKSLTLHDGYFSDDLLNRALPRLPNLEQLDLRPYVNQGRFTVVSQSLKHIIVKLKLNRFHEVCTDTPNLEHFIYHHAFNDNCLIWGDNFEDSSYLPVYKMDNFAPEKATVKLRAKYLKRLKFAELLRKINRQSKYMEVQIDSCDVRKISKCKPCPEIKHVVLLNHNSEELLQTVDGALRLFPDAETVVVSQRKDVRKEVDQSSDCWEENEEILRCSAADSYDYTVAIFEAMN